MAAAAFKATMIFARNSPNGPRFSILATATDIAAALYIFPSGSSDYTLPNVPCYLVDLILSPGYGTDTTTGEIFANAKTTGESIINSANQHSTVDRQFRSAAVGFLPGAVIRVAQRA